MTTYTYSCRQTTRQIKAMEIQRSYLKIGRTTHPLPIPRSWVQWIPPMKILVRTNDRLSMEILWSSINNILSSPPLLLDLPLHFSSCNDLLLDRDLCVFPSWLEFIQESKEKKSLNKLTANFPRLFRTWPYLQIFPYWGFNCCLPHYRNLDLDLLLAWK
jgi:hypothetical protein